MGDKSKWDASGRPERIARWDERVRKFLFLWIAASLLAWGQAAPPAHKAHARGAIGSPAPAREGERATGDLDSCRVDRVTSLPGSGQFASDFLEAMAGDPGAKGRNAVWALSADLSSKVAEPERAMYISKSADGGKTWTMVARLDSRYFNADIGEGERNGLSVSPGGSEFVITTQKGAFQVIPRTGKQEAVVRSIAGPRVPKPDPEVTIPKKEGDPVTANVVKITADGRRLLVGYGYFDLHPQIVTYHRGRDGKWVPDGAQHETLPPLPTDLDLLSMEFGDAQSADARSLYLGTGDQAFLLRAHAREWTQIDGVGDDSAIQGISTVGGPHLAACWGVYNPTRADAVERVIHASFLLHRNEDEAGPNIRAFSIEVDPARPNREVVTSLTGVYTSSDRGQSWKRLNDVPDGEFRSSHINADGTVIVSGIFGTYLASPFSKGCSFQLKRR